MHESLILNRERSIFFDDIIAYEEHLSTRISSSKFLILGGAGSIGQEIVKQIFARSPKKLHVIDISENNLVELVRDIRSSIGYIEGDFQTLSIDIRSLEFENYFRNAGEFDYVLNLSALKHVRSEKDPYTLMRMIDVNIFGTKKALEMSIEKGVKNYFCVSTDKAANPVNMMGATKSVMEMYLAQRRHEIKISMARFANIAFSDGSLLFGFTKRVRKRQPIVAPHDVQRYFMTPQEAGELCIMSCMFGTDSDIFIPKTEGGLQPQTFSNMAKRYLRSIGLEPHECTSEEEARKHAQFIRDDALSWPCFFSESNTTGEKLLEEFFTNDEILDLETFQTIGIIKNSVKINSKALMIFEDSLNKIKLSSNWHKNDILELFKTLLPDFCHDEKKRYLDAKM